MTPPIHRASVLYLNDRPKEHLSLRWAVRAVGAPIQLQHFTRPEVLQDYLDGQAFCARLARAGRSLALLDFNVEPRLSLALIRWIRAQERFNPLPVLMYSSDDNATLVQHCYAAGGNLFLRKPAHFERLQALVLAIAKAFSLGEPDLGPLKGLAEYRPRCEQYLRSNAQSAVF